jgi:hypothetical protein
MSGLEGPGYIHPPLRGEEQQCLDIKMGNFDARHTYCFAVPSGFGAL